MRLLAPRRRLLTSPCSYVKQVISDLLQNRIDMSQLVITKALTKASATGALILL